MCFSATASFSAAAIIGAIGVVTIMKAAKSGRLVMLPYAAIPLLFAAQQFVEGFLWLEIVNQQSGACRPFLINGFVGTAEVIWPAFAPLTVWLMEPVISRRRILLVLTVCGFAFAAWMLFLMITLPYHATMQEAGIVYRNAYRPPWGIYLAYGLVAIVSFAMSSYREVRWFSVVILTGLVVALVFYTRAYISVWCFFAAIASAVVYLHIVRVEKDRFAEIL